MESELKRLQSAEKEGDITTYIALATELLGKESSQYPQAILKNIRMRLEWYTERTSTSRRERTLEDICSNLTTSDIGLLSKCIPFCKLQREQGSDLTTEWPDLKRISIPDLIDIDLTKDKRIHAKLCKSLRCGDTLIFYQLSIDSNPKLVRLQGEIKQNIIESADDCLITIQNEFMPIFFCCVNEAGAIIDASFIPYPTLLRNGIHYGELAAMHGDKDNIEALNAHARGILEAKPNMRIETIVFQSVYRDAGIGRTNDDFRDWLEKVHRIEIIDDTNNDSTTGSQTLILPEKSYPSLSVIINGVQASEKTTGSINIYRLILVREYDFFPHKLLKAACIVEDESTDVGGGPFPRLVSKEGMQQLLTFNTDPVCLCSLFNQPKQRLFPDECPQVIHLDNHNEVKNSCINVVAIANEAHSFTETHLLSLFYQNNITIGNLIILCKKSEITQIKTTINTLRRKWRMQTPITVTTDIGALARHLEANFCEHTLFVNTYIVLQNRNILQHLRLIAKQKNIFSAGCMLNHIHTSNEKEIYANSSAGLYPRLDEYTRSGFLHLEATNILSGLIPTQISVIANTPDLSLINTTKLLKDLPDLDSSKDITRVLLHASCLASLHNMYNIVSTKVAAQYSMSPTPNMSYYIGKKTTDALVSQWHKISGKISMCEDVMA